ncbi:MAG: hypothetical protein ING69_10715 [Rhodocyclaceae bacterium]|nr:hypothetical protein [Rhodocyclaceae bacterium]
MSESPPPPPSSPPIPPSKPGSATCPRCAGPLTMKRENGRKTRWCRRCGPVDWPR